MRNTKRLLIVATTFMLFPVFATSMMAEDNSDRIAEIEAQIAELQAELADLRNQEQAHATSEQDTSDCIQEIAVYEFPDGSAAVRLRNVSDETICIDLSIDIEDSNGKLVGDYEDTFFGVLPDTDVLFDFYKQRASDVIEVQYNVSEFNYEISEEEWHDYFESNTDLIKYEETRDEDYEKIIAFTNTSNEEVVIYPYIVWYKDGEVVGVEEGSGGNVAAGDTIAEEYMYPRYNDEWIIPDNYEIIVGPTVY